MKPLAIFSLAVAVTACGIKPEPPAISDISNADSLVRVQARNAGHYFSSKWPTERAIRKEGQAGCQTFKKPAVLLSRRCIKTSNPRDLFDYCVLREYLFACKIE